MFCVVIFSDFEQGFIDSFECGTLVFVMSKLPEAVPCPDKPPLHLKGGYLCVAAPVDLTEACFSVPAVRALRHSRPQSTMAILCPESQQGLWASMPEVNHVIIYQEKASARQIAQILADFEITFESAVVWEAGKPAKALVRVGVIQRLGYPASGLEKLLTDVVTVAAVPGPIEHRVRYYLNFVDKLGCDAFVGVNFKQIGLPKPPERLRIAIAPLSEYGSAYQWPIERWVEVIDAMDTRHPEVDWEILGTGAVHDDRDNTDARIKLEALAAGKAISLPAKLDLVKVMESLSKASALLACDGEIAHIAAHIGLPAAVIFGPNEPEWKRPLGKQSLVLREHVACSPCYLAECPLDHRCQHEVSVEKVVTALEEALKLRCSN